MILCEWFHLLKSMFSNTQASRPRPLVFLQKVHLSETEDKMSVLSVGWNDIIVNCRIISKLHCSKQQLTSWILANIKLVFTILSKLTNLEKTDHLRVQKCCVVVFDKLDGKPKSVGWWILETSEVWQQECESYCCFYVGHYWINNHSRCETKHLTTSSKQTKKMHSEQNHFTLIKEFWKMWHFIDHKLKGSK